jgi:hypothetical protein
LIIDRDYQKTAAAAGITVNKTKGDDLSDFPMEKARLKVFGISWDFQWHAQLDMVGPLKGEL